MFAKCIILLAAVAQIYGCSCKIGCAAPAPAVVASPCASSCAGATAAIPVAAAAAPAVTSGAVVKNVVAKGKYPVALRNCGPTPDKQIPVVTTRVNAPAQVKPTVRLPCSVPAPKCICHTCTCYKTVLRPRVHQQIITVPTIERYIENTHKPVIENIQYEAIPVNCGDESSCGAGLQFVEVGGGIASAPVASCAPVVPAPIAPCAPVVPAPIAPCAPVVPAPITPCAPVVPAPIPRCAPVVPAPVPRCAPVVPAPVAPCASIIPAPRVSCGCC